MDDSCERVPGWWRPECSQKSWGRAAPDRHGTQEEPPSASTMVFATNKNTMMMLVHTTNYNNNNNHNHNHNHHFDSSDHHHHHPNDEVDGTNNNNNNNTPVISMPSEMEDLFKGHKVVALPSRGRPVEPTNIHSSPSRSFVRTHRSLSAGRSRARPSDIVQDVYDRMGIHYKRGDDVVAADPLLTSGSRSANANANTTTSVTHRGRGAEKELEQERPRSLSRGRIASVWPPAHVAANLSNSTSHLVLTSNTYRRGNLDPSKEPSLSAPKRSVGTFAPASPQTGGSANRRPSSSLAFTTTTTTTTSKGTTNGKDESKEKEEGKTSLQVAIPAPDHHGEDEREDILRISPLSIKDRISMYGGSCGKSNKSNHSATPKKTLKKTTTKPPPPQIDIYEQHPLQQRNSNEFKFTEEKKDDEYTKSPRSSRQEATAELARIRQGANCDILDVSKTSYSTRHTSARNLTSSFFASTIQPNTKVEQNKSFQSESHTSGGGGAPMLEIAAANNDDRSINNDAGSAALSSVSGDEFTPTNNRHQKAKSYWNERNRVTAYAAPTAAAVPSMTSKFNNDAMERLIDERVQARMNSLETRIEAQLRRFMQQMEERIIAKLDAIESSRGSNHEF